MWAHLTSDGLRARALRSSFLTGGSFATQNAIRLIGNLILTRLLFPEAFGLMALVQVVMTGLNMFSNIGIRSSIIQDPRAEDPAFQNTAWTIQIARGLLLWLVVWLIAGPAADFYDEPILASMLPVAGLVAIFQGFNSTKMIMANRELRIGRVTAVTIGTQIAGLLVMIVLALWLQSVWALVIGSLVSPFLVAVLSHFVLPGAINRLALEADAARRVIGFGKYIFIATLAGFLINHADKAILGKIVSLTDLALYNIAFFLASVPLLMMRTLAGNVLFPLYRTKPPSESADNRAKIRRARVLVVASLLALTLGLALIGNWMVVILYDSRYEAAGPLLPLIALAQIPTLIGSAYDQMALARGDSRRFAAIVVVGAVLRTAALFAGGAWLGLIGIVLAPAVAGLVYYPLLAMMIRRYGGFDLRSDLVFMAAGLAGSVVVLYVNAPAIADAWVMFTPR